MMTDFYGESESHKRAGELMRRVFVETFGGETGGCGRGAPV